VGAPPFPRRAEGVRYCLEDTSTVLQNVIVPEAKNAPTVSAQDAVPYFVIAIALMLATIGFDNEPSLHASKIDDIGRDRV
jgi:hypothetical protein